MNFRLCNCSRGEIIERYITVSGLVVVWIHVYYKAARLLSVLLSFLITCISGHDFKARDLDKSGISLMSVLIILRISSIDALPMIEIGSERYVHRAFLEELPQLPLPNNSTCRCPFLITHRRS